ncbi:thiol reductant ABC exporter subunit CydD [Oxalicibacterium faecigallinarum]|nr:thiol reductant ABC exporter subunit CydD [Oxalicibacterium faecigallinarum]
MKQAAAMFSQLRLSQGRGRGSFFQTVASLIWIPQAALLAYSLQMLADGHGVRAVVMPALAIFVLAVARAVTDMIGLRLVFKSARARLGALRANLVQSLAMRSPIDPQRPASGMAASAMAEQTEAVLPYLVRYQPARLRATVVPLVIFAVVFAVSWLAGLILLVAAPLIPIFMALVGWRAKAASDAHMGEIGNMNAFLLDRLRGLTTIRALDAVGATAQRLHDTAQALRRRTITVLRIAFLSSAVLELFAALGVAMVAVYVGFHLLGQLNFGAWSDKLTLGQGLFVLLLAPAFFEPLRELSAVWHDRAAGEAALDQIEQLMQEGMHMPENGLRMVDAVTPARAVKTPPSITIRNLHFAYPDGVQVFNGLHAHVRAGEHVALVAPSGAGKSTLQALIAGMAIAQHGDILVDGVPLQADTVSALRARMAWIGQKPHVFAGSVRSNIALGRKEIGKDDVELALHLAALHKVPQAQPGVMLGEMGGGLSGGEAVRLALARAAANPHADILLVDEPTAHLDRETSEQVMRALLRLAKDKTMLVATHDPALIEQLDRSIVLGEEVRVRA